MDELPADVLARVSEDAQAVVSRLWANLTDKQRGHLVAERDERRESQFFAPELDDCWEKLILRGPVIV